MITCEEHAPAIAAGARAAFERHAPADPVFAMAWERLGPETRAAYRALSAAVLAAGGDAVAAARAVWLSEGKNTVAGMSRPDNRRPIADLVAECAAAAAAQRALGRRMAA